MRCLSIYANLSSVFLLVQIPSFSYLLSISTTIPEEDYLALMELNGQFPLYGTVSVLWVARKISLLRNSINTNLNQQLELNETKTYFHILDKQIKSERKNE
ncbi:hypothetical protein GCK72_022484 [Caenorhabditis remanei]|uniref:Uncharacterized protein n=1 Tax=Caenorhabditis remanei TaxID=31234 RepID=A0A6A5FU09_CAERE|nr:hypothetical protein GCK72_022484 [Caenorhabditis remanei]KAF1746033.1 hypothetical protein GCK72_022484 [Caenorhabditis remanei]